MLVIVIVHVILLSFMEPDVFSVVMQYMPPNVYTALFSAYLYHTYNVRVRGGCSGRCVLSPGAELKRKMVKKKGK